MSLEQRNKKVAEHFAKYNIGEWGNGNLRTVRIIIYLWINFDFIIYSLKSKGKCRSNVYDTPTRMND